MSNGANMNTEPDLITIEVEFSDGSLEDYEVDRDPWVWRENLVMAVEQSMTYLPVTNVKSWKRRD